MRQLCRNYSPALLGIIRKVISSQELAEEVLQDVFVKIWEKAGQFDPEKGRLFTWMARIARNHAIDTVRSATYRRQNKTDGMDDLVYNDKSLSEEMFVNHIGLKKVTDQLDDKYRILIEYLYFKDYSQSEAAEELGIPLGTLKSRIRKAVTDLKTILKKERMLLAISLLALLLYLF